MSEQQGKVEQWNIPAQSISRPPTYAPGVEVEAETYRAPINYVKWGLGCTGVLMVLFTVSAMFALILTPVVFRNLLPEQQEAWAHRLPFLQAFKPTRIYQEDKLPTAVVNEDAAMALLDGGSQSGDGSGGAAVSSAEIALVSTPTALPTLTPTLGTPKPTSVLATNTPVIATAIPTETLPATATLPPTATAALPTLAPTQIPIPSSAFVTGIKFVQQEWNNCGPANMTQVLHKYGWTGTQADAAAYLKPWREDKNVSPWQMVNFVNNNSEQFGLRAIYRVGGTTQLLKTLIANDFGLIIEKGHIIVGQGWMGHYLTMQGYDDSARAFYGMDTNAGPGPNGNGTAFPYDELDRRWQQFNRVFIVIYPTSREAELATLLGGYIDDSWAIQAAYNTAKQEASATGGANPYVWFNLGSALTLQGKYSDAAIAFDKARQIGLDFRFFWYQFEIYDAYYNSGRLNDILELTQVTLQSASDGRGIGLEEQHYWRGMVFAAEGQNDDASKEFETALDWNKNFYPAAEYLAQVQNGSFKPPQVAQSN
ncbi:MAG: C39 family peptidase [Anaerolineae bacterium]|nr:C39 family peptidase [Anaerolineae bacterium]